MIGLEYIIRTFEYEYKDIALLLGIDKANITIWINGKRKIPQKWVSYLAEYFNLPEYLFQKELDLKEQLKITIQHLGNIPFDESPNDLDELIELEKELSGTFNYITANTPKIAEMDLDYSGAEDELHMAKRAIAQHYITAHTRFKMFMENRELDLSDKESIFRVIDKLTELLDHAISEDKLYEICNELEFEISEHYEYEDDDDNESAD